MAIRRLEIRPTTAIALMALLALSALLLALSTVPLDQAILALSIIWIAALPGLLFLQNNEQQAIPFLPFVGLYYILFFGLPFFLKPFAYLSGDSVAVHQVVILEPMRSVVLLLLVGGITALIAAFYVAKYTLLRGMPHFRMPGVQVRNMELNSLYSILLIGSLAFRFSPTIQSLPSIGQFLGPASFVAFGGFYLQWRAKKLPRSLGLAVLLIALPLELLWRIENLFITELLLLFLFFVFVLWRERQFKTLTALAVICVLIASTYGATGVSRHRADNIVDRLALSGKQLVETFRAPRNSEREVRGRVIRSDPLFSPLVDRIGQIWFFQMVYDRTPDPVPFWGGRTYKPIFTSFIPRVFYPNKPEERAGGEFGLRYGIISANSNSTTSINISWPTELLANFGTAGVLIGMALFGAFLAFLDKTFNARRMSEPEFVVGLTIIFPLVYQESNFTVMTGSMLPLFVALWLYFTFGGKLLRWLRASLGASSTSGPS